MLTDQARALVRVAELVDAEQCWRADRRAVVLGVLRGVVCGMSWASGLVSGVTRAHLAAAAGCSPRTVSRVLAWAVEAELVVCVETGATAEFLGTEYNRAPSYVVTVPVDWAPPVPLELDELVGSGNVVDQVRGGSRGRDVDGVGNPPVSHVEKRSPWRDRKLNDKNKQHHDQTPAARRARGRVSAGSWTRRDVPETAGQRAAAAGLLLEAAGIAARVVPWRAVAVLSPWFAAGWCVAGLLWAIDHHPDEPAPDPRRTRGDAARGARDPLAVLTHRLAPWRARPDDLPADRRGVAPGVRRARAAELERRVGAAEDAAPRRHQPTSSAAARAAALAAVPPGRLSARPRATRLGQGPGPAMTTRTTSSALDNVPSRARLFDRSSGSSPDPS